MRDESAHRVDTVLAALRDADAPQGMEDRIQAALLHVPEQRKATSVRWLPLAGACSIGMVFLLLGSTLLLAHNRGGGSRDGGLHGRAASEAASARSTSPVHRAEPSVLAAPVESALAVSTAGKHAMRRVRAARFEAVAASGMPRYEYIPEPPLPVTDQERLLLKVVHRDTAEHLAAYTEPARALQARKESWQFHAFFTPPPRPPEPLLESQLVSSPQTDDQHSTGESR